MTTERDLIQRLADELELWIFDAEEEDIERAHGHVDAARAYLAQPEPAAGPTDEELLHVAASAVDPYESCGIAPGEYEAETECAVEAYGSELIAFARAVLARWGHQPPQPIPLSERLPEAEDCDAEGRCWFWADQLSDSDEEWGWKLLDRTSGINWSGGPWLPHHALPVPGEVEA